MFSHHGAVFRQRKKRSVFNWTNQLVSRSGTCSRLERNQGSLKQWFLVAKEAFWRQKASFWCQKKPFGKRLSPKPKTQNTLKPG